MTLAIAYNSLDPFTAWQAENAAARCNRMAAIITIADCERNRNQTYIDCRCSGCGGFDNQAEPQPERPELALVWDADKEPAASTVADDGGDVAEIGVADQRGCILDEEELDDVLAEMFPIDELDDADDEDNQERAYIEDPPESKGRRVPVYMGCCARCGDGYMSNVLEAQFDIRDDAVYRCHSCGWRTSVQYENNRALFAAGGVI